MSLSNFEIRKVSSGAIRTHFGTIALRPMAAPLLIWKSTFIEEVSPKAAAGRRRSQSEPPRDAPSESCPVLVAEREYVAGLETQAHKLWFLTSEDARFSTESTAATASDESDCDGNARCLVPDMSSGEVSAPKTRWSRGSDEELVASMARYAELPELLANAMRQQNLEKVTDVRCHINVLCRSVVTDNATPKELAAIQLLEGIPELLAKCLEDSIASGKAILQRRIEGLNDAVLSGDLGPKGLVQQMQSSLPAVMADVAEAALQALTRKVGPHADQALAVIHGCEGLAHRGSGETGSWGSLCCAKAFASAVRASASQQVQRAVAVATPVQHRGASSQGSIEAALSGQAPGSCKPTTAGSSDNRGSIGHPDFCKRPCIQFSHGKCTRGENCLFCHLPHHKRSPHLDKRHRNLLQQLPFSQRAAVALPIVRKLAGRFDVAEVQDIIELLATHANSAPPDEEPARKLPSKGSSLLRSLAALGFRALMTAICRSPDTPECLRQDALERSFERISGQVHHV